MLFSFVMNTYNSQLLYTVFKIFRLWTCKKSKTSYNGVQSWLSRLVLYWSWSGTIFPLYILVVNYICSNLSATQHFTIPTSHLWFHRTPKTFICSMLDLNQPFWITQNTESTLDLMLNLKFRGWIFYKLYYRLIL